LQICYSSKAELRLKWVSISESDSAGRHARRFFGHRGRIGDADGPNEQMRIVPEAVRQSCIK
jgi:hypothetical protein